MDSKVTLQIGSSVNIARSNGRIHPAHISSIDYDTQVAIVEWCENELSKGKEIDLSEIESLNPNLLMPSFQNQRSQKNSQQIQQNRTRIALTKRTPSSHNVTTPSASKYAQESTNSRDAKEVDTRVTTFRTTTASSPISNHRTNTLKEVAKIKKNREERKRRFIDDKIALKMFPRNPHSQLLTMINEFRRGLHINPLTENDNIEDHLITVCVRQRPLNKTELARKEVNIVTIPSKNELIVHEPKSKVDLTKYLDNQIFRFDYAFDETCTNDIVYKYTAQPLVKSMFEGAFATCFAYGQTGAGKTHTMGGTFTGKTQNYQKGIYALAASDVFRLANCARFKDSHFIVSCSFFEIYSGKVFDLLNKKEKLKILEDNKQQVQVVGLTETAVTSVEEVLKLIQKGTLERTSGQTSANANSSRSHAVFQIMLRFRNTMSKIYGKFSLIDLAGNERGADTSSANRSTRIEGAEINKSLLALKECIRALGRKGSHLPFRVSKLTHVLKDSFVGSNSKTCMIAMLSPGISSCEHSLNTLRYADRVKELGVRDSNHNQDIEENNVEQLRSLNEEDMSQETVNFSHAISDLQIAEEIMVDNHKQCIEYVNAAMVKAENLLRLTNYVEYDQEGYCNNLEKIINKTIETLLKSKQVVDNFRSKMANEEQLNRRINGNN